MLLVRVREVTGMMGRSLVSDISHVSRVMVCVVLDMLHPAVR